MPIPINEPTCKSLGIELLKNGSVHCLYFITFHRETVQDYLDKLKREDIIRFDALWARIEKVAKTDKQYLSENTFRRLKGKIFEIKSHKDRIGCFFVENNGLILTHGFKKQTQKTPRKEIKKAEQLMAQYESMDSNKYGGRQ